MHSAFKLTQLIPPSSLGTDGITAILLHQRQVVVGTDKGDLLIFERPSASTSRATSHAQLISRHDSFSKRPIDQLGYLEELNAFICLSGGDVGLYDVSTLSIIMSLSGQTRSAASLFVLSSTSSLAPSTAAPSSRRTPSTSSNIPISDETSRLRTILAVACKRKLILFHWVDKIWITPTELTLPHQIRGMDFLEPDPVKGTTKIMAGFSTGDYGVVSLGSNSTIPVLGELFSPGIPSTLVTSTPSSTSISSSPSAATVPSGGALERLGGLAKVTNVMKLSSLGMGNLSLSSKKLERNEVIAARKSHGKGRAEVNARIDWMFKREWGWEEDKLDEREVLVLRDNVALPLVFSLQAKTSAPVPRSSSSTSTAAALVYPIAPSEIVLSNPYILSLLPPSSTSNRPHLLVHSMEDLSPIQNITVPLSISPAASISEDSSTSTPVTTSSARLLTAASSSSSLHDAPLLFVLSSSSPFSSSADKDAAVLIANDQSIWIIEMNSWTEQVEELGRAGSWEHAVRLLRKSSQRGIDLPNTLLTRLSHLHALSLFRKRSYDLAIDAFISLNIAPPKIVSLYPANISGKLALDENEIESQFGGRSTADVTLARDAEREELKLAEALRASEENAVVKDGDVSITSASKGSISKASWMIASRSAASISSIDPALTTEAPSVFAEREALAKVKNGQIDSSRSIDVLIRYLTDRRQKYALALSALPALQRPSSMTSRIPATAVELYHLPDLPLDELSIEQLVQVAVITDTTLFRCYLSEKKMMLGSLCRIENWCEVEEVEEALLAAQKYAELLDLYNGKLMHRKAVELLKRMSADETDPEEKVGPTVRYLQKLGSAHLDLIFQSSNWIFEVDQNAGLQIFIADLEEVESLPRHATMHHLEKVDIAVCAAYIEHLIHDLGEEGADFHEKLIELYLSRIDISPSQSSDKKDPASDESYRKLIKFLESSMAYRADRILGRLPSEEIYEVRAILLGRLGRHEGALAIYVNQLKDNATAEEYCARVYQSTPAMRPSIFHLLLRLYLLPSSSTSSDFTLSPALALLKNHATSLSPIAVLDLLPPLLPLERIQTFLEKSLRKSGEQVREGNILSQLVKGEQEGVKLEVVQWEEKRVKITEMRTCPQCYKRLGNSVIAIHAPSGEVTHYQCREEFQQNRLK